jgi:aryl-alcohol dehydrogenase-like predicted oxidoreductase
LRAVHYRRLGRSGLEVSEIALGTWLTVGSKLDAAASGKIVRRAFDLGVNLFDTADVYANGAAEVDLGRAIADLPRRHLVLATKAFFPASPQANDHGLSRKHLVESVEESLRRLGTDYLDLHQCHRADPNTPIEETVRTYEDLIRQGKVLYWGVSVWGGEQIEEAAEIADRTGGYRMISNQPQYSMLRREVEVDVIPASVRVGASQIVYSPLAQGALTGKYSGGARPDDSRAADGFRSQWMQDFLAADGLARVDALQPIAKELGLSLPQLALAWCLREPHVASTLVGVTRLEQLEDNVGASGCQLPEEALERIEALFPPPKS